MNWVELALGLGIGGAAGAALAVLAAGTGLAHSWEAFSLVFRAYVHGRSDPDTIELNQSFEALRQSLDRLMGAVRRLRSALRWK